MHYAGLDVSMKETAICVVDERGLIVREGATPSEPEAIGNWLEQAGVEVGQVGLEIGGLARGLHVGLRELGLPPSASIPGSSAA